MKRFMPILCLFALCTATIVNVFLGCDITNPLDHFQLILDVPVEEQIHQDDTMTGQSPSNTLLVQNVHVTGGTAAKATAAFEIQSPVSGWIRLMGSFENTGVSAVKVSIFTGPVGGAATTLLDTLWLPAFGDTGTINTETSISTSQSVYITASGSGPVDVLVQSLTLFLPSQIVITKDISIDDLDEYAITNVTGTEIGGTLTNNSSVAVEVVILFNTNATMNHDDHSIFEATLNTSSSLNLATTNPNVTGINTAITNQQDLYFEFWMIATDNISDLSVDIVGLIFSATVQASTDI